MLLGLMSDPATRTPALLALLLLVPIPSIGSATALWIAPGPLGQAVYFICKLWILVLPVVWRLRVERGRLSLSPARHGGFVFGAGSGLVLGAAIIASYAGLAAPSVDPDSLRSVATASGFDRPGIYLALAAYFTFVNALLEEYVWRWFVFTRCERLLPRGAAVVVAAAGFTAHHVIVLRSFLPWGLAVWGACGVFAGGVVWNWCYLRYRSIWPGYVSHVLVDAAILSVGWKLLFAAG
jgi:membrane protease YdiL (CAAX protease family)